MPDYHVERLTSPSFDALWLPQVNSDDFSYIFVAGGGGHAKSGVKNEIVSLIEQYWNW